MSDMDLDQQTRELRRKAAGLTTKRRRKLAERLIQRCAELDQFLSKRSSIVFTAHD